MRFSRVLALAGSIALAQAGPIADSIEEADLPIVKRDGVSYKVFKDADLGSTMHMVVNSGVCETTPGVKTISGYFSVSDVPGADMNMFFWFFEARKNPAQAPFAAWFNGGPGCSSLIGLLQENGPCQFYNNASEPSLNKYSYNEYANMIYVDQPIGVGFSYGTDTVTSTVTAAPFVWRLFQAFLKKYPKYKSRDFGIMTESYGGHYGPEFASYIQQQNAMIASGSLKAQKINLIALGINNGITDDAILNQAYIDFSYHNKYKQLINESTRNQIQKAYNQQYLPLHKQCKTTDSPLYNAQCVAADQAASQFVSGPIFDSGVDFDVYDVRQGSNDPFPPGTFQTWLNRADIQKKIGAHPTNYQYCSNAAGLQFVPTGDDDRNFLPTLSKVVQSGIQVLLFAGDADWICNHVNVERVADAVKWKNQKQFQQLPLKPYTVNGKETGLYKSLGTFSYVQVYEAGHEVPYYQPETALQLFVQSMQRKPATPT